MGLYMPNRTKTVKENYNFGLTIQASIGYTLMILETPYLAVKNKLEIRRSVNKFYKNNLESKL